MDRVKPGRRHAEFVMPEIISTAWARASGRDPRYSLCKLYFIIKACLPPLVRSRP
jgi:hypothetical protein